MTGSRDMQFRGISDGHRDALVKQSLSLGIEQLDIVASWPKRELLGFVRCRGETAVNVHRRVLSLGFDLQLTVVRRDVVGQIRVIGICPWEERVEWFHDDDALPRSRSLGPRGRRQAQKKYARDRKCKRNRK